MPDGAKSTLEKALWTIPAERMKARRVHRVPLSKQALALLASLPRDPDTDLVFPSVTGKMLSDMTLTALMRRKGLKAVPHGFRSTFCDWAADCTSFERDMRESALAHRLDSKTEAAYMRTDMLERRRRMMQEWADSCDGVAQSDPAVSESS